MNKKFSTLLAGVMLASAMSVGAQTAVQKYESNKSFLLGDGSDFISVVSDPTDPNYGKLIALPSASINTLTATNNSLWTILVTPGVNGNAPKFSYINKATGLTLSVDASKLSATNTDDPAVIGGSTSEWLNTAVTDAGNSTLAAAALKSYLNANEVAYLEKGTVSVGGGTELLVKKAKATDALSYALQVAPYRPATVDKITAEDLNTQLGTAEAGWFNLSFNRDVTSTGFNLFANTSLKAEDLNTSTPDGWVRLMAKDKKAYDKQAYIVVDTAYHKGTENSAKLVKFTYANIDEQTTGKGDNKQTRVAGSYNYKFSYDPFEDRLLVWVENYNTKAASTAAPRVVVT